MLTNTEISKEIKNFLEHEGNPNVDVSVLKTMLEYVADLKKDLKDWNQEDVVLWLKSIKSTSIVAIYSRISFMNRYREYIGLKKIDITTVQIDSVLDYNTLLSITISYLEYRNIMSQLTNKDNVSQRISYRDIVIFQLAWLGLTNEQIKNLKNEDIQFDKNIMDEDIVVIKTPTNQFVSNDDQLILNIKQCMQEDCYYVYSKDGRIKRMTLLHSEYLIRPVSVGRITESHGNVANPSIILQSLFDKFNITCNNVDVQNLTIESIRRSKIIYLLNKDNSRYFSIEFIANLFDITSETLLYFYRKISNMKYK